MYVCTLKMVLVTKIALTCLPSKIVIIVFIIITSGGESLYWQYTNTLMYILPTFLLYNFHNKNHGPEQVSCNNMTFLYCIDNIWRIASPRAPLKIF